MRAPEQQHPVPGRPAQRRTLNIYIDGYNFYVAIHRQAKQHHEDYELAWCDFLRLGEHLAVRLSREHPALFGGYALGAVKYFTATIPNQLPHDDRGVRLKHMWLDAVHFQSGGRVEICHGTFRWRQKHVYVGPDEINDLARAGVPIDWERLDQTRQAYQHNVRLVEEKQTDVMLACALVRDAALGAAGRAADPQPQPTGEHRTNPRPSEAPCHAALVLSADTDFLPAAEIAARSFGCAVAIAFTYPHEGFSLDDYPTALGCPIVTCRASREELKEHRLPERIERAGIVIDWRQYQAAGKKMHAGKD